jgi:transcriptional regulator with XRE-family HTH domain
MSELFGKRLKEMRLQRRRTQQQMAEMLGISAVGYGSWERGSSEPPLERLVDICRYLKVSANWLVGLDEEDNKPSILEHVTSLRQEVDRAKAIIARLSAQTAEIEKML